jgi:pimeloyl-ACP methyl ester carboxylesterase
VSPLSSLPPPPHTHTSSFADLPCLSRAKNNAKASNLETFCRRTNRSFLCADYYGVGRSDGSWGEGNLSRWKEDSIRLMEQVMPGRKFVLVGAGVGGWIAHLIALTSPELVAGVVGLAADPDFTEDLLWATLSDSDKDSIMENGVHEIQWGDVSYPISRSLIEDGRENLILRKGKGGLKITCPVRLLHGMSDEEVPYQTALTLADTISGDDVVVTLSKYGKHQLDEEEDFARMREAVDDVFGSVLSYDLRSPASG